ncbi:MAG: hypothetical protein IPK55_13365 [Streptococcus sp.]|nr:hypothetical protein [Streptococcus sp.]
MLEIQIKQVEITKNYGPSQFREFLKEMMFTGGIEGKQLSFVLTDTQIVAESFLEDVNNLLNTGEVPNLMEQEDKDKIINGVRPVVVQMKRIDTIDIINATFVE